MKKTIQITLDGPAGSGKSTVAKRLAEKLSFEHLDTGAIYRSLAYWSLEQESQQPSIYDEFSYTFKNKKGKKKHFVNGVDVTERIRTVEIAEKASEIAQDPKIRKICTAIQREIAGEKNIVAEGRDAGSVVFKDAAYKFYLTASLKERAKRRWLEMRDQTKNKLLKIEEVMALLEERDKRDSSREFSPLVCAPGATEIDTTDLSIDQVVQMLAKKVQKRKSVKWRPISTMLLGKEVAKTHFMYRIVFFTARTFFRCFYDLKVYGLENYKPKEAVIIAPNHVSFLDPPVIGSICPEEVWAIGQDYLFKAPLLRWVLPKINTLPVTNTASDKGMIKKVIGLLVRGKKVVIFPEGQRSHDGKLQEMKRGTGMILSQAKCKIMPVIIEGAFEAYPPKAKRPKFRGHKISVLFGEPLDWNDYEQRCSSSKEAQAEILKDLKQRMSEMQQAFRERLKKEGRLTKR